MSYTSKQFLIFDNSTDANFRAWGSAISAAISAMGWTKTSDLTGQVDWGTVASPAAGAYVWEIWSPGDAGTSFKVKIEYGSTGGATKGPRVKMSIGTNSNGSGTLTGFISVIMDAGANSGVGQGSTATFDCYFSGDVDRLSMMLWRNLSAGSNSTPYIFSVERTHNSDGTNNNEGVTLLAFSRSGTNPVQQQTLVLGVGTGVASADWCYIVLSNNKNASGAFNNNIPISPCFPDYGKYANPLTTIGFIHTQDVAEACFFSTSLYGQTRTYIATGNFGAAFPLYSKVCMRYD